MAGDIKWSEVGVNPTLSRNCVETRKVSKPGRLFCYRSIRPRRKVGPLELAGVPKSPTFPPSTLGGVLYV